MSQNHLPYEKRRLLYGDDPQGYKLRDWPTNQRVVRAAEAHEKKTGHATIDLMDDTPENDVVCGICCLRCDWVGVFPYSGLRIPKKFERGRKAQK